MGAQGFDLVALRQPSRRSIESTTMTRKKENDRVVPPDVRIPDKKLVEVFYYLSFSRLFIREKHYLR